MGVKASVLAADKQEKVDEIVKLILATFKSQYLSEYAAQLVQQFKDELEEEAEQKKAKELAEKKDNALMYRQIMAQDDARDGIDSGGSNF